MNDQLRSEAASMYRNRLISTVGYPCPHVGSAEALMDLAKRAAAPEFEAERGWRTDPPFPGAAETPQEMPSGRWRMICASRLIVGDLEAGVIFTTIYSGKASAVTLAAAGTVIPNEYKALV